jgi:hypothetical protein
MTAHVENRDINKQAKRKGQLTPVRMHAQWASLAGVEGMQEWDGVVLGVMGGHGRDSSLEM